MRDAWLIAIDVNYYLHRQWYAGAGLEAASGVSEWIQRTVERLKIKGLTDAVACFDSKTNHRKELTKDWDDRYKPRPPKDPELGHQLNLVHELLAHSGILCVGIPGYEADDLLASYANQFEGKVTLFTGDKDARQCLSSTCNILLDVEWKDDETSGDVIPDYKWISSRKHTEETGIPPSHWVEYQCLMGDSADGVTGAIGIGSKGAAGLINGFGTAWLAIKAAKDGDERIKPAKRQALIDFEDKLDVTRKLVTLVTDLDVPMTTRV